MAETMSKREAVRIGFEYLPLPKICQNLSDIANSCRLWTCRVGYRNARSTESVEPVGAKILAVSGDGLLLHKFVVHSLRGEGKFEVLSINGEREVQRFNRVLGTELDYVDLIGKVVNIKILEILLRACVNHY